MHPSPFTHARAIGGRPPATYWGAAFVVLIALCWGAGFVVGFEAALAALALLGFAAAVIGVFQPVVGILGIGLLCTIDPLTNAFLLTGGLFRWNTFNYWLLLVALISLPVLLRHNSVQDRLVQIFAALLALELLVSPSWYTGLQDVAGIAALFGMVVYFARVRGDPSAWYWLGLICGTTGAVGGVAYFMQQSTLPDVNANAWAFFPLTALFAICLAFPLARPWRRGQAILGMLAAANYTLVFLSGSRGALLTGTGCALLLLVQTQRVRGRWAIAFSAVLVAFALTTQFTDLETKALDRIGLLLNSQERLVNRTSGRSVLLVSGWNIFLKHPLGVGTGGFAVARVDLNLTTGQLSGWRAREEKAAHAGWIKILAENGLPGFALMSAYVLSFAVCGWRSRNRDALLLGLVVTLGLGLGLVSTEYQSKGLWFLAAGATALLSARGSATRDALQPA